METNNSCMRQGHLQSCQHCCKCFSFVKKFYILKCKTAPLKFHPNYLLVIVAALYTCLHYYTGRYTRHAFHDVPQGTQCFSRAVDPDFRRRTTAACRQYKLTRVASKIRSAFTKCFEKKHVRYKTGSNRKHYGVSIGMFFCFELIFH